MHWALASLPSQVKACETTVHNAPHLVMGCTAPSGHRPRRRRNGLCRRELFLAPLDEGHRSDRDRPTDENGCEIRRRACARSGERRSPRSSHVHPNTGFRCQRGGAEEGPGRCCTRAQRQPDGRRRAHARDHADDRRDGNSRGPVERKELGRPEGKDDRRPVELRSDRPAAKDCARFLRHRKREGARGGANGGRHSDRGWGDQRRAGDWLARAGGDIGRRPIDRARHGQGAEGSGA